MANTRWILLLGLLQTAKGEAADKVYEGSILPIFGKYCMDCHDDETRKGKFSLEHLDPDMVSGDNLEQWRLIEEQVYFLDMPPKDKKQPGADERKALLSWIQAELLKTQSPHQIGSSKLLLPQYGNYVDHSALFGKRLPRVYPAPPRIWRLRPEIYDATVPRLGERITGLANGLAVSDGPGIKDYSAPYFLDEAATAPLLGNAKKVAANLCSNKGKDRIFRELANPGATNSPQLANDAIELAFRKILARPPTTEEKQRYAAFYHHSRETGGESTAAIALLAAILMQPEVLYRQELGDGMPDEFGRVRLTQTETAYALSYALGDQPAQDFTNAASQGKLGSKERIAASLAKQLKDDSLLQDKNPRVLTFFREYFNYPFALEVFKDQPEGGKHEANRLIADLETTIQDILRADKDVLRELLTTRKFYVNAGYKKGKDNKIALHEGHNRIWPYQTTFNLPHDWKWSLANQPIEFPKEERAGILTHPAWLAAWSGNFENHPVQRGKWVRTHLLGGTVPDVPIGVDARVPEKEHTSFRDRLHEATKAPQCQRCHNKMDPIGVAFEMYDHYGRIQRLDAGQPVDSSCRIDRTMHPGVHGEFPSPIALVGHLAKSPHVEQVFTRYVFRFFLGRNETLGDANTLQDAHQAYRESGGSFRALVQSILTSDSFLLRQTIVGQSTE